jgi:hypothetical protein
VAALSARLVSSCVVFDGPDDEGRPVSSELCDALRRIVKSRTFPKGAHFQLAGGYGRTRLEGRNSKPIDIEMCKITLELWLDRYPAEPGVEGPPRDVLIRLQHIGTRPSEPMR